MLDSNYKRLSCCAPVLLVPLINGLCTAPACLNKALSKSLCRLHYRRMRDWGVLDSSPERNAPNGTRKLPCSIDGCVDKVVSKRLCQKHLYAMRFHGDPHYKRIVKPKALLLVKLRLMIERRACKHCHSLFEIVRNKTVYCSQSCQRTGKAGWRKNPEADGKHSKVFFNTCQVCKKHWTGRKDKPVCEGPCKDLYAKVQYKASFLSEAVREERSCDVCSGLFISRTAAQITCSKRCAKNKNGSKTHRKRARRHGVEYEPVNVTKVFDRDGWKCQICGTRTPKARRGSINGNAPELDHRIPLSKGGGHVYSNVQCACRRCNCAKGNSNSSGQVPLFEL